MKNGNCEISSQYDHWFKLTTTSKYCTGRWSVMWNEAKFPVW